MASTRDWRDAVRPMQRREAEFTSRTTPLVPGPRQAELAQDGLHHTHALPCEIRCVSDEKEIVHEDEDVNAAPRHPSADLVGYGLSHSTKVQRTETVTEWQARAP
eukprot:4892557-Prymnesium_polylepis.3